MKFYNLLIKYRLQLGIALIIIGGATNYFSGFWPAFPLYFVGLILVLGHFFFGPLRLIQEYLESGDMEGAEKVLNTIKFPGLLYKPIRSAYYTLKGNVAMMKQDYDGAEKMMKKGLDLGMPMKEAEGASMLQMGMLSIILRVRPRCPCQCLSNASGVKITGAVISVACWLFFIFEVFVVYTTKKNMPGDNPMSGALRIFKKKCSF